MSTSVIYFIQAGDDGPIKIGVTRGCPLDRMAALQTGCPDALKLIAHASGTIDDEQELHKRFAHLHLRGEWFLAKPELTGFIRGIRFYARNEKPLERRDEPMIGDLCLEDLERIATYVMLHVLEKRAASLCMVAQLPFPLTAHIRLASEDMCHQLDDLEYDRHDIASEMAQLMDIDRLFELRDDLKEELEKSDADKGAEYASIPVEAS